MKPIFITGIGTGIGKTLVAAIVAEALHADYWKPVQAGFADGTDALQVKKLITNTSSVIYKEVYKLKMPASPHIAAREDGITINLQTIADAYRQLSAGNRQLIIEGAGGLLAPLNGHEFVIDLIKKLNAKVILVSRNYLGSINHSLLTAAMCKANNIDVSGWIFNDQYMQYENEIAVWSKLSIIASIPLAMEVDKAFVQQQAQVIQQSLSSSISV